VTERPSGSINTMTAQEAEKIFKEWQGYVEIADKLSKIFTVVPESFLPYPLETMEEALNITAKKCFDSGNREMAKSIQETMALWLNCKKDEEALILMKKELDLVLSNQDLKEAYLQNLKTSKDSWLETKSFSKK
jgi:hypothetical protein